MSECDFKKFYPRDTWRFGATGYQAWPSASGSRKMRHPAYGDFTPKERAIKRCPSCNKRLRLKAKYCVGGEFVCWELPDHAIRETRKPSPRRKEKRQRRGS